MATMKFDPIKCPQCGEPARGTLEEVLGCAMFTEPDASGAVDYEGETEIYWDDQKSVLNNGKYLLVCSNGHNWVATRTEQTEEGGSDSK